MEMEGSSLFWARVKTMYMQIQSLWSAGFRAMAKRDEKSGNGTDADENEAFGIITIPIHPFGCNPGVVAFHAGVGGDDAHEQVRLIAAAAQTESSSTKKRQSAESFRNDRGKPSSKKSKIGDDDMDLDRGVVNYTERDPSEQENDRTSAEAGQARAAASESDARAAQILSQTAAAQATTAIDDLAKLVQCHKAIRSMPEDEQGPFDALYAGLMDKYTRDHVPDEE